MGQMLCDPQELPDDAAIRIFHHKWAAFAKRLPYRIIVVDVADKIGLNAEVFASHTRHRSADFDVLARAHLVDDDLNFEAAHAPLQLNSSIWVHF